MDPLTVIRTMWHHKAFVLPVVLAVLIAAGYVFQFGPRYFESSMSYALVNPKSPTDAELEANPELVNLNRDNPFLRSSDPSLITEVVIARLGSSQTSAKLDAAGLSTDYTVGKGINGNGFVVSITGNGESEEEALATTRAVGELLQDELRGVQKINNADDRFLFAALVVNSADKATEQFSSRLRSVIMVLLGGSVLMFGAVAFARSLEASRTRRTTAHRKATDAKAALKSEGSPIVAPPLRSSTAGASLRPQIPSPRIHVPSGKSEPGVREESFATREPARRR